jgi:hypothetical protein
MVVFGDHCEERARKASWVDGREVDGGEIRSDSKIRGQQSELVAPRDLLGRREGGKSRLQSQKYRFSW